MKQRVLVPQGKIWYLGTYDTAGLPSNPASITVALDAGFDLDVPYDDIYPVDYPRRLRNSMIAAQAESLYAAHHTTTKTFPVASVTVSPEQQLVTIYHNLVRASDITKMGHFDYDFNTGEVTIKKSSVTFHGREPIPYKIAHVAGNCTITVTSNDDIRKLPLTVDGTLTVGNRVTGQTDFRHWVFQEATSLSLLANNLTRVNITFAPGAKVEAIHISANTLTDLRGFSRLIVGNQFGVTVASGTFSLDGLPENVGELYLGLTESTKVNILPMLLMRNPPKNITGMGDTDIIYQILNTVRQVPKLQRIAAIKRELAGARGKEFKNIARQIVISLRT